MNRRSWLPPLMIVLLLTMPFSPVVGEGAWLVFAERFNPVGIATDGNGTVLIVSSQPVTIAGLSPDGTPPGEIPIGRAVPSYLAVDPATELLWHPRNDGTLLVINPASGQTGEPPDLALMGLDTSQIYDVVTGNPAPW